MISRPRNLQLAAEGYAVVWNISALLLLLGAMMWLFPTTVTGLALTTSSQETFFVPHTFSQVPAVYEIEGTLQLDFRPSTRHLTLRADDCVEFVAVDGVPIFHQVCATCRHCNPFQLALPENLVAGVHQISIRMRNLQGLSTFDLLQAHGFGLLEGGVCLAIALAWLWVVRRRQMSMWAWWIVVGAMLLAFGYHLSTDLWTRQMDAAEHRQYVEYVLMQHSLPRVDAGMETFQPPLYYILSAAWIGLGAGLSPMESWRWLQVLAMLAYLATVMIGVSIWHTLGLARSSWPGLALLAFLPAHVYLSARIDNDVLLPVIGTLVVFLLWEYAQHDRLSSLGFLSLCLVLAMTIKLHGLALFGAAVVFLGWLEWNKGRTKLQMMDRLSWVVVPGLIWILAWGLVGFEQTGSILYSNAAFVSSRLKVVNDAYRYFSFDFQAIATEPFFNTWGGPIRTSWPTALLVSTLFGEYNLGYLGWQFLSSLAVAFVPVAGLTVIGFLFKPDSSRMRPWLVAVLLVTSQALFLIAGNWIYRLGAGEDARYWAPVFFPLALLCGWGYEVCLTKSSGILRWVCRLIPIVFFVLLGIFYVRLIVP